MLLFLLVGCSNTEENETSSFNKMKEEVNEVFQLAKDGKYNIILFDIQLKISIFLLQKNNNCICL